MGQQRIVTSVLEAVCRVMERLSFQLRPGTALSRSHRPFASLRTSLSALSPPPRLLTLPTFFFQQVGYSQFINVDGGSGTDSLRALRALRALRPLRTVSQVGLCTPRHIFIATVFSLRGEECVGDISCVHRVDSHGNGSNCKGANMTEKRDAAIDRFCSLQVKSLRTIANSFVDAVPMLMSVVGVLFFYMVRRFCILWPFRRTACHGTPRIIRV